MKTFLSIFLLSMMAMKVAAHEPDSLDIKIGQMIMIGINDRNSLAEDDPLVEELKAGKIGGVLIFEKNLTKENSKENLKALIQNMQSHVSIPLFVSIDEEGGKVHRLKEKYGFVAMPSAAYLGRLDNADSTLYYNRRLAAELKELGINLNYAPDVDLAMNPNNTVIVKNERSFGADPDKVAKHAALCIQAHHEYGIKTILKHFPGHGSSTADSHFGIVDVTSTWNFKELYPYEQLIETGNVDAVMTAHIINARWDEDRLPATLSEAVVQGMLRNLLNFQGAVFSDDMQMQAISNQYGFENAIKLAINAGVDVLMFANSTTEKDKIVTASKIHAAIRKMVVRHKISRERIDEAYAHIMALKNKK